MYYIYHIIQLQQELAFHIMMRKTDDDDDGEGVDDDDGEGVDDDDDGGDDDDDDGGDDDKDSSTASLHVCRLLQELAVAARTDIPTS